MKLRRVRNGEHGHATLHLVGAGGRCTIAAVRPSMKCGGSSRNP
jgi:hypothetical protein